MRIFKDALPSGLSYAVKPSMLEEAIAVGAVQTETVLYQRRSGWVASKVLFRADFYPAGRYYRNQEEILTITSRAVPASLRASARAFIEGGVMPDFIKWITGLERLPVGSPIRREKQSFEREWTAPPDHAA